MFDVPTQLNLKNMFQSHLVRSTQELCPPGGVSVILIDELRLRLLSIKYSLSFCKELKKYSRKLDLFLFQTSQILLKSINKLYTTYHI